MIGASDSTNTAWLVLGVITLRLPARIGWCDTTPRITLGGVGDLAFMGGSWFCGGDWNTRPERDPAGRAGDAGVVVVVVASFGDTICPAMTTALPSTSSSSRKHRTQMQTRQQHVTNKIHAATKINQ